MGYTFSSADVRKSMTAGRPQPMASRSAGSISSYSLTVMPTAPNASARSLKSGWTSTQVNE